MSGRPSDIKLKLKDVVVAVREVTEWHDLGLQLGLPEHVLKVIAAHPNVEEHQRMMLSKWLEYDTSACWEKLVAALLTMGKNVCAENVRRRYLGLVPVQSGAVVEQDAKQRLAMTETVLRKIRSRFSLLVMDVQSSLEKREVNVKKVYQFLLNFFQGECDIPDVGDMTKLFNSITTAKLWRYDHYGPLEELAESLLPEDDSARAQLTEYKTQLSGFKGTARIITCFQNGRTALMCASAAGEADTVRVLLDHGAVVDVRDNNGCTALMVKGEADTVRVLLDDGAVVDVRDNDGWTALIYASVKGEAETVRILLDRGAVVDVRDNKGLTALMYASVNGEADTVRVLLDHGAVVDLRDNNGGTALMYASRLGEADTVWVLLDHGAMVDVRDNNGGTALMCASGAGEADTVRVLLDHGAVVDLSDSNGWTALMWASAAGEADTVRVLLDHGAVIDVRNDNGRTSLWWASSKGKSETVEVLVKFGAQLDIPADEGEGGTALSVACQRGHGETAKILLDHGAATGYQDKSPLVLACVGGHTETVKVLLESKLAQVDLQDDEGWTALFFAAELNLVEIVKMLVAHGAAVDIRSKAGLTAFDVATAESNMAVCEVLTQYVSQGTKVDTQQPVEERETDRQHQRTEGESQQEERESESQQQGGTELTEEQRAEVRSVGERIWEQFKRIFLTELVRKKELTGQHQREQGISSHIIDQPKGRISRLNRWNIFSQLGRQRRQRQRQVVGTAPAPE